MKELQSIFTRLAQLKASASPAHSVLATLVQVEGSSYRRVGARLLWNADGLRVGSISGGCLEEDLLLRARRVLTSGVPETVVYDTTDENDLVWGVGLGCHGIVHVLLERLQGFPDPLRAVEAAWERREPAVLVSRFNDIDPARNGMIAVFSAGDSGLQTENAFALRDGVDLIPSKGRSSEATGVFRSCNVPFTFGKEADSSRLDSAARANGISLEMINAVFAKRVSMTAVISETREVSPERPARTSGEGDTASRSATGTTGSLLYEFLPPPLRLFVWGAGDDAQPLVRFAKELGWRVTLADPRSAYATAGRFPDADEIRVETEPSLSKDNVDPRTVAVIMSHHYRFDVPALRILLPLELPYLGLLGPKKRAEKMWTDLSESGLQISPTWRANLRAPVGFDIGASTPEQVALAIVAEIEAVINGRDGRPLRERLRPIHA